MVSSSLEFDLLEQSLIKEMKNYIYNKQIILIVFTWIVILLFDISKSLKRDYFNFFVFFWLQASTGYGKAFLYLNETTQTFFLCLLSIVNFLKISANIQ